MLITWQCVWSACAELLDHIEIALNTLLRKSCPFWAEWCACFEIFKEWTNFQAKSIWQLHHFLVQDWGDCKSYGYKICCLWERQGPTNERWCQKFYRLVPYSPCVHICTVVSETKLNSRELFMLTCLNDSCSRMTSFHTNMKSFPEIFDFFRYDQMIPGNER